MKGLCLAGLSHKTAPVEWRERLALSEEAVGVLRERLADSGIRESVLLSTCNRVELYAVGEEGEGRCLKEALVAVRGDKRLEEALYERRDMDAVRHLFRVTSGLDSLVIGENEILGQVKRAYDQAGAAGLTSKLTNVLFQRAIFVGKKVRTVTSISEGPTSVPALAASLAERIFGDLRNCRVLILGAGAMAEGTLHALLSQKAGSVVVINRTWERAEALVRSFPRAEARPLDRLMETMAESDILLCSTGAAETVISRPMVEDVLRRRRQRPLFFIDIAVPRDVEPSIDGMDGVFLYNIDDLESLVKETLVKRGGEIDKAVRLTEDQAEAFKDWYEAWRTGGTAALRHAPRSA